METFTSLKEHEFIILLRHDFLLRGRRKSPHEFLP